MSMLKRLLEGDSAETKASKRSVKKKKKISFHQKPSLFDQLTIPMNCFNLVTQTYLFQPSYRWTIDGIKEMTERKKIELSSEMFQWKGYPIQARAKLRIKEDDCVYMSLCLNDDASKDEISELRNCAPIPQVFYVLKDQKTRQHVCETELYQSGAAFSYSLAFDLNLVHKSWLQHSAYNVDDSVEIGIYVEPSPMVHHVHSYNGTLHWVIDNYSRRLQLERDSLVLYQESPYFYTSPRGFRVQVRIFLNKEEEGGGPTAQILFLTGKFDDKLPESFPHCSTVSLINRTEPQRGIKKTMVGDIRSKKEYSFEICKFEEMENVVENDALFCEVSIHQHVKHKN